jgi:hypothetical protein
MSLLTNLYPDSRKASAKAFVSWQIPPLPSDTGVDRKGHVGREYHDIL